VISPEFVPLADALLPPRTPSTVPPLVETAVPCDHVAESESGAEASVPVAEDPSNDVARALREARLFRARLQDAFDDALARLVRELAAEVLARELALAPCDVRALAQRIAGTTPFVRLRVAPEDVSSLAGRVDTVADPALHPGDAIVELAGGAIDARLGVRLAAVLEHVA